MSNADVINQVCDKGYRLPFPQKIQIPEELYKLMLECWTEPDQRPTFDQIYNQLEQIERDYFDIPESISQQETRASPQATEYEKPSRILYGSTVYGNEKND